MRLRSFVLDRVTIWIRFVPRLRRIRAVPGIAAYTNDFILLNGVAVLVHVDRLWCAGFIISISWG